MPFVQSTIINPVIQSQESVQEIISNFLTSRIVVIILVLVIRFILRLIKENIKASIRWNKAKKVIKRYMQEKERITEIEKITETDSAFKGHPL